MKILQLTERYPPAVGGVETHVMRLSQELHQMGLEITAVTTDLVTTNPFARFDSKNTELGSGIKVIRVKAYPLLPFRQGLGYISPGMLGYLKNVDLVHAHGYGHFPTYLISLCKAMRLPCVVTTHSDAGRLSFRKRVFDIVVPPLTLKFASEVIAISNHERRVLTNLGVEGRRISVIPNGVDASEFANTLGKLKSERKSVLYAGRIDIEQKGLDILVKAFSSLLRNSRMKLELNLMGPDWSNSTTRLRELGRKLGSLDSIRFLGFQNRTKFIEEMLDASVFVLPSRFEPFGIVLLEALAAGVPVVASRVGAIPEILQEGRFGFLFESENDNSLKEKLEYVLTHPDHAIQIAQEGRRGLSKYSWKNVALATADVYRRARFGRNVS